MTVKVNSVVLPFLPSDLITSLMLIGGGGGRHVPVAVVEQDRDVSEPMRDAAASGRASALKSAMTREDWLEPRQRS